MERLNEVQLTYPPSAAVDILASPSTLRSRSILASLRVAISMPVVLSSKVHDRDEQDGEKIAGERRQKAPVKALKRAGFPRQCQMRDRLLREHPAVGLRLRER